MCHEGKHRTIVFSTCFQATRSRCFPLPDRVTPLACLPRCTVRRKATERIRKQFCIAINILQIYGYLN